MVNTDKPLLDIRKRARMKIKYLKNLIAIYIFLLLSPVAWADLVVITANEADLPYSLSSSKYANSSSKYSNSISKYSNSSSKYSNSSSKYKNSPSNYKNGESGDRRLLIGESGSYFYIGYYVMNDDGVINYFSPNGERLFYTPPETGALFHGERGHFCGTLATLNDELVLVLTEKGQMTFLEKEIAITKKPKSSKGSAIGIYTGVGSGHWIQDNVESGSMIILEDGSIWEIDTIDKIDAMLWLPLSNITVVESNSGSPGFDYLLINTDDGEKAHAKYIGSK